MLIESNKLKEMKQEQIKIEKARRSWPSMCYLHKSNTKVKSIVNTLAISITMLIVQLDLILDISFVLDQIQAGLDVTFRSVYLSCPCWHYLTAKAFDRLMSGNQQTENPTSLAFQRDWGQYEESPLAGFSITDIGLRVALTDR